MKVQNIRKKLKLLFVVALSLCFLAFSNEQILFAAAPTVITGAAVNIDKTYATLIGSITDDGGLLTSDVGVEYGLTSSYGSSVSGSPIHEFNSVFVGSAGTGNGQFDPGGGSPNSIVVDSNGDIYVADMGNNRVQKFDSSGIFIREIGGAGTAEGQFGSPKGISVDSNDNLYVADSGNRRVQKFDSDGNFLFMFGFGVDTGANQFEICISSCEAGLFGSGNGQFRNPTSTATDSFDNVFVADFNVDRFQKFNSSGVLQNEYQSSGTSDGQFNGLRAIAIDEDDNIFVGDYNNNNFRVQKFNSAYTFLDSAVSGAGTNAYSITISSDGNVYASSAVPAGFNGVVALDGNLTGIAGSFNLALGGETATGSGIDSLDSIYITDAANSRVQKFTRTKISLDITDLDCGTTYHYRAFATNADGTSYGSDATFTTSACDTPTVSTDLSSNVTRTTVTLNGTHLTEGVDTSTLRGFEYGETTSYGTTVTSPGSLSLMQFGYEDTVEGAFESPYGIALDSTGNIYVSDTGNNRIQEFDPGGNFMNMIGWGVAGGVGLETCTTGCTLGTSGSGDGELNAPRGIMIDAAGNINIADYGNNRVQKITPAGSFVSKFGTLGSGVTNLSGPSDVGLVFGNNGPAFLDTGNNRIRPCATYTGCPATDIGTTILNAPEAMDRSGMFVADTGDSQIHKFVNLGQAVQVTASYATDIGGLSGPKGIASEDDGALVYVSDTGHDRLLKFSAAGSTGANVIPVTLKFISQFGSSGSASGQFSSPSHIAINSDNEIFVADTGNHRIQKLSPFFSEDITGLNCGTTYHYRALATNTDGTGYGSDQTFRTSNCSTTTSSGGGPTPRYGCTDPTASNWDFIANTDDGSCEYLGCTDNFANNYNEYALTDDGSCDYTVYVPGCIDTLANNYNPSAEIDDGSCTYGTGTPGCMNPLATNYNASATSDDGSCVIPGGEGPNDILGCTDTFAENFDASATQDNGTCHYVISSVAGCMDEDALNYNPSAMTNDGSCTYEPPPWFPPPLVEIIDTINGAIREVTGWTPEEQANTYKDIAVVGIVVPSLFFLIAERSAILSAIIRLWNIIPTLLGFRRKRRPWGTVYDSVTKQPLDPVYVTLRDTAGAEVSTSITDLDGRYGFVTDIGEYKLDAKKTDYVFPSVKMNGQLRDELYENLYFGENIKVDAEDMIINKNIPMDALNFNWNEFEKTKNKKLMKFFSRTELFLARIAKIIFIAGFIASFLLIFLEPKMWNYIILAVYVTIFILSLLGVRPRKPGFILERETGYPLSFAIITVFSALLNREIAHTVVGKTGKYHILVPKGKYYLKLQKKTGENSYEEIYTSDVFKARKGYIDKTIKV